MEEVAFELEPKYTFWGRGVKKSSTEKKYSYKRKLASRLGSLWSE